MTSANSVASYTAPSVNSGLGQLAQTMNMIQANSRSNNAVASAMALANRNWQAEQNQKAMDFNLQEAQKNRDWQQMMSNTAHQREVADLKAAGLNPILSATGGNGAAVTSGATASGVTSSGGQASPDTSANNALVSVLSTILSAQTNLEAQRMSAQTNLAIAEKNNAASQLVAEISAAASRYGADQSAAASRYGSDTSMSVQKSKEYHDEYMTKEYPDNMWKAISSALSGFLGTGVSDTANTGRTFFDKIVGSLGLDKFGSSGETRGGGRRATRSFFERLFG